MKNYLGIDFGLHYLGLALASTPLAEPLTTIKYKNDEKLFKKLMFLIESNDIDVLIIGLSEGDMAKKTQNFALKLKKLFKGLVYFQDETLSSKEAQKKSVLAGKSKTDRRNKNHQFAATLILQDFLDTNQDNL